ncbi:MAG: universal stress protein [Bacteroidota bacterium]|nr:universal stress protein [Bacteroidota bacterium]
MVSDRYTSYKIKLLQLLNNKIDLVVMATYGSGGWSGLIVGSTTEK